MTPDKQGSAHFYITYGLFVFFVWVLLGSVWASWPSWSRLGAILGRLDAIFDVLELCAVFGSSPEAVCNIRAALAKKAKCRTPPVLIMRAPGFALGRIEEGSLHEVVSQPVDP